MPYVIRRHLRLILRIKLERSLERIPLKSMNDLLHNLIEALREELKQYGEMLAMLEQQQQSVVHRQTNALLQNIAEVNAQSNIIAAVRHEREQRRCHVARH